MENSLNIFNVTNKADPLLDELACTPAGVGNNDFPKNYLSCKVVITFSTKILIMLSMFFIIGFGKICLKNMTKIHG